MSDHHLLIDEFQALKDASPMPWLSEVLTIDNFSSYLLDVPLVDNRLIFPPPPLSLDSPHTPRPAPDDGNHVLAPDTVLRVPATPGMDQPLHQHPPPHDAHHTPASFANWIATVEIDVVAEDDSNFDARGSPPATIDRADFETPADAVRSAPEPAAPTKPRKSGVRRRLTYDSSDARPTKASRRSSQRRSGGRPRKYPALAMAEEFEQKCLAEQRDPDKLSGPERQQIAKVLSNARRQARDRERNRFLMWISTKHPELLTEYRTDPANVMKIDVYNIL